MENAYSMQCYLKKKQTHPTNLLARCPLGRKSDKQCAIGVCQIYTSYGEAEGREEETFWRQENFGWAQIPQLIVCSIAGSVLGSVVDNESQCGSDCFLNHLILTVEKHEHDQ